MLTLYGVNTFCHTVVDQTIKRGRRRRGKKRKRRRRKRRIGKRRKKKKCQGCVVTDTGLIIAGV
jgi:hypothetical protein